MPGVAFIPNTPDPGHPGRFLTPVRAPAGNVGGAFLPDVFGLSARQCVEAAFGADPFADPSAWAWVDITRYVQWDPGVDISIGYEDESVRLKPGSMAVKLRNDQAGGGYFTLDNDNSPFAPYVRENTPIRARLDVGGGWSLRFQGYATGWTPSRGPGGESWVSLQANGISRRKRQGRKASPKSAMRRSYDTDPTQPIEYWPLEGGKGRAVSYGVIANTPSAQGGFVSLVDGDAGAAQFGSVSLGDGSDDVVNIAGGWSLDLNMPYGTPATGTVVLEFSMAFGTTVRTGTTHTCGIRLNPYVAARHLAFNVNITDAGAVQLAWYEQDSGLNGLAGPTFIYNTGSENIFDGQPRVFQLWLLAYGSTDVDWALFENDELLSNGTITPSFAGAMNAAPWRSHSFSTASATATVALGHVAVWNTLPDVARYSPLIGWRGETPTARLARLCAEEGVPITIYGTSDLPMGPQGIEVFPDLLDAAAKTDQGSLFDGLGPGYTYIAREQAYSQRASLILDATAAPGGDLTGRTDGAHDDQGRVNSYTASNGDRLERTFTQTAGALGTDAVGVYEGGDIYSIDGVDALAQMAAFKVGQGTVPGLRWPRLGFQLAKPYTSRLAAAWLACLPLTRIDARGISTGTKPDRQLILRGWREQWTSKTWAPTINVTPYDAYKVSVTAPDTGASGDFFGWLDVDDVRTVNELLIGGTSITVDVVGTALIHPLMSTYADDLIGLYINIDGMRVGVTGITTPVGTRQTISINGADVVRNVPPGTAIFAADPFVLGL